VLNWLDATAIYMRDYAGRRKQAQDMTLSQNELRDECDGERISRMRRDSIGDVLQWRRCARRLEGAFFRARGVEALAWFTHARMISTGRRNPPGSI